MKWLSYLSMCSLLFVSGCEDLECDPTFVESMGACVCPTGQVPVDVGDTERCEPCPAGSMPVGEMCVSIGDAGMDAPDEDTGGDPCGGTCSGDTPHCDVDGDTCVACLENSHCDGSAPVCGADGTCGPCAGAADCGDYPGTVCDDAGDGACVACVEHSDCTDADAAQCDATTNTCVPCEDGSHCTEAGAGVCDTSAATNTCVECTADDESACGANVCDVVDQTCTDVPEGGTGLCTECVSDRQCMEGQVCAPMDYRDGDTPLTDLGHFCLWRRDASVGGGPDGSCLSVRPYAQTEEVTTLSGETVRVCSLAVSTCAALGDFRMTDCDTPFDSDLDCGEGLGDGLCRMVPDEVVNRCTMPCSSNEDCRDSHFCQTDATPAFCRLDTMPPT